MSNDARIILREDHRVALLRQLTGAQEGVSHLHDLEHHGIIDALAYHRDRIAAKMPQGVAVCAAYFKTMTWHQGDTR